MANHSATWTWIDGNWHEGNVPIAGPRTHAMWLGSMVFDGGRVFEGIAPDMDLHCKRVNDSATAFGLLPGMPVGQMLELEQEARAKFTSGVPLYVRPMYWAEEGGDYAVPPKPESTRFCLCVYEEPMPPETATFTLGISTFMRPTLQQAPVNAKAGCLYPNSARAIAEAKARGFSNGLIRDSLGNVAELATANVFFAKDGVVHTPAPNGTFLNGITRQRVIWLLRRAGVEVVEGFYRPEHFLAADEIFSSGNFSKVMACSRIEDRDLQPGPLYARARALYWDWAHG